MLNFARRSVCMKCQMAAPPGSGSGSSYPPRSGYRERDRNRSRSRSRDRHYGRNRSRSGERGGSRYDRDRDRDRERDRDRDRPVSERHQEQDDAPADTCDGRCARGSCPVRSVYVTGLASDMTESDVATAFSEVGRLAADGVTYSSENGTATLTFETPEDAHGSKRYFDGTEVRDRRVKVVMTPRWLAAVTTTTAAPQENNTVVPATEEQAAAFDAPQESYVERE
jgi:hypothetical protein